MLTGRKLLLADDSLTIQKVVSLTFNDEAMEVVTVGSGAQAVEKLNESLPDIVLADVFMPEPNGYQLCERIKRDERLRHIPVVLLVGTFEPFNEAEARRVGADDVLTKPFQSIRDLVNKVGGLLGGEHADEKTTLGDHLRDDKREEEEAAATMHDLSPLSMEARAVDAASATMNAHADAFGDFDLDDATIQTMPAAEFEAREHASASTSAPVFSEINEEEQFSDRGETDEAFVLSIGSPDTDPEMIPRTQTDMDASTQTHLHPASAATPSEGSPLAQSAFAAQMARATEADDALLELGDIMPQRRSAAEADDFILDIGDEELFDAAPTPQPRAAKEDEDNLLFAESAPAAQEPELFEEAENLVSSAPVIGNVPAPFAKEPEEVPEWTQEEAVWEMPAPTAESASTFDSAPAVMQEIMARESAPAFESEVAPAATVAAASESKMVAAQETSPAPIQQEQTSHLSPEMLDEVVRRVVAQMSEQVVREIAWEVVPDLAERLIKQRLEEERSRAQ